MKKPSKALPAHEERTDALLRAVEEGDAKLVEQLLAQGADANIVPDPRHDAPLWAALKKGRLDILSALEKAGGRLKDILAEPEDAQLAIGWVLRSKAPEADQLALLDALARAGVDLGGAFEEHVGSGRKSIRHPVIEAVRAGAFAVAERLVRASRPRAFGEIIVELAALPPSPEILQIARLVLPSAVTEDAIYEPMNKGRRDLVELVIATEAGRSAASLWAAIALADDEAWALAMIARGADVNARDEKRGLTPLLTAAIHGRAAVVARLIDLGVDLEAADREGNTALMLAAENEHLDVVTTLAARGAKVAGKDALGETLLHRFAAAGGEAKLFELAFHHRLDAGEANAQGETPLHLLMTAEKVDDRGLALLLRAKVNVDARDATGKTPLHRAAARAKGSKLVSMLLGRKAKVDSKDSLGRTPLHYAAAGSDAASVKALVEGKASLDAVDEFGLTPRDIARITKSKAGAAIASDKARAPRVLRRHDALGEPLLKALKGAWQKRVLEVLPLVRLRIPLVPSADAGARSRLFAKSAPLPPGAAWPVVAGAPHAALAVIDLRDLKAFDFEGLFPDSGTLVLFAGRADSDATSVAQARIVPASAPEAARPAAANALYKSHPAEVRVAFGAPTLELPHPQGSPLLGEDDDRADYEELRARVRAIDVAKLLGKKIPAQAKARESTIVAALLGHTTPLQEATEPLTAFLAARKLPARARADAATRDLAAAPWRVLASLGVHDGGFDHDHVWFIDERDLEARKLETALYVFDHE